MRIEATITMRDLVDHPRSSWGFPMKIRERLLLKELGIRFIGSHLPSFMDPAAHVEFEGSLTCWEDKQTGAMHYVQEIDDVSDE